MIYGKTLSFLKRHFLRVTRGSRKETFLVFFPLLTTTTALRARGKKAESAEIVSFLGLFVLLEKTSFAFLRKKYRREGQLPYLVCIGNGDKRSLPRNPLGPFLMQMEYFGRCGSIWMPCATAISEPGRQRGGELSALDSRQQPLSLAEP